MNLTEFTQRLLAEITKYHGHAEGRQAAAVEISHLVKNVYEAAVSPAPDQKKVESGSATEELKTESKKKAPANEA